MKLWTSTRLRQIFASSIGTLAGSAVGALLPFFVTAWFGASRTTDAYFLAAGTSIFVIGVLGIAIEGVIVPFASQWRTGGQSHFVRSTHRTGLQASGAALLLGGLAIAIMKWLVLPHTNFTAPQEHSALQLLWILLPLPMLVAFNSALAGAHYSLKRFSLPAWSQGLRSIGGLLLGLAFRQRLGVTAIAIGVVIGELTRSGLLLHSLRSHAGAVLERVGAAHQKGRSIWWVALPQMLSMLIVGLNPLVDKAISAGMVAGSVTVIELAEKLFFTPMTLLWAGVGIVSGAAWADLASSRATHAQLRHDYWRSQRIATALGGALAVASGAFAWFLRGQAGAVLHLREPRLFASVFILYALGMPFAVFGNLGMRLLISFRRTGWLPLLAGVSLAVNFVLDLVGAHFLGVAGIAVSSTGYRVASAIAYIFISRRLLKVPADSDAIEEQLCVALAS